MNAVVYLRVGALDCRAVRGVAHNFVVMRTDTAPDKLALDTQTQKAKEEEGRVGGIEEPFPAGTRNLRLDLQPGHYVLICNVPTRYQLGMRTRAHGQVARRGRSPGAGRPVLRRGAACPREWPRASRASRRFSFTIISSVLFDRNEILA